MIRNLRHTGIVVADLDQAVDFYVGQLGFEITRRMDEGGAYLSEILGISDVRATTVKMSVSGDGQGGMIELLYFPDHQTANRKLELISRGPTHIALTVSDLDSLYSRLIDYGISFISSPKIAPEGAVKIAFCRAPDGTFLELVEDL